MKVSLIVCILLLSANAFAFGSKRAISRVTIPQTPPPQTNPTPANPIVTPAPTPTPGSQTVSFLPGHRISNLMVSGMIMAKSNTTYSGLKISNPSGNCVVLDNVENVKIVDSEIGPCGGVGIATEKSKNVTIEYNTFHDLQGGVYAYNSSGGGHVIHKNKFYNIKKGDSPRGQNVQFNAVSGAGNRITCNVGDNSVNVPNALMEDHINIFASNGTAASPIEIANNKVKGGTTGLSITGCGIMVGDNGGSYITARDNIVVNPGGCSFAIAGGNNIKLINNISYNVNPFTEIGAYIWNQHTSACSNNTITGNKGYAIRRDKVANHWWDGGGCTNTTLSNNNFADTSMSPLIYNQNFSACDSFY